MESNLFLSKYYVAIEYKHNTPLTVEEFPGTEQGLKDAIAYKEIMSRTKEGKKYIVMASFMDASNTDD